MRNHIRFRTILKDSIVSESLPDQLIIRVGKGCNFRCIFCNVAENEAVLNLKPSIKEILALAFYRIKYSNFTSGYLNITISGGEPSIFQNETLFVLRYFSEYFNKRDIKISFSLQSNASNIDQVFAKNLAKYSVTQALVSSHAHDPHIYKEIIGVPYEIMGLKFEKGVRNLLDVHIPVTFNIILNKINAPHYIDHLKYLLNKFPEIELYNIGFVQPHGMAQENFEKLFIQYNDIYKVYSDAIAYLKGKGKRVHSHLVGLPICHLDDWSASMEHYHNKNIIIAGGENQTLIQAINDVNKTHTKECISCMGKRHCSGVWKEYAGIQKLRPIPYFQFPEIQNERCVFVFGDDYSQLKKARDSGVKQVFVYAHDYDYEPGRLPEILQSFRPFGFLMISIVMEDTSQEWDMAIFASMNIQLLYNPENTRIINKVRDYNKQVPFQFQVHLDIHITENHNQPGILYINSQDEDDNILYHFRFISSYTRKEMVKRQDVLFYKFKIPSGK